jgi:hypothetical protein
MLRAHLAPCPACTRLVRVDERTCPFCAAALDESFRATPMPRPSAGRLSRAAMAALGAGTVSVAFACAPEMKVLYGGPPIPEAGEASTPADAGAVTPATIDSGDAHVVQQPVSAPAYGAAPVPVTPPAPAYGAPPPGR